MATAVGLTRIPASSSYPASSPAPPFQCVPVPDPLWRPALPRHRSLLGSTRTPTPVAYCRPGRPVPVQCLVRLAPYPSNFVRSRSPRTSTRLAASSHTTPIAPMHLLTLVAGRSPSTPLQLPGPPSSVLAHSAFCSTRSTARSALPRYRRSRSHRPSSPTRLIAISVASLPGVRLARPSALRCFSLCRDLWCRWPSSSCCGW